MSSTHVRFFNFTCLFLSWMTCILWPSMTSATTKDKFIQFRPHTFPKIILLIHSIYNMQFKLFYNIFAYRSTEGTHIEYAYIQHLPWPCSVFYCIYWKKTSRQYKYHKSNSIECVLLLLIVVRDMTRVKLYSFNAGFPYQIYYCTCITHSTDPVFSSLFIAIPDLRFISHTIYERVYLNSLWMFCTGWSLAMQRRLCARVCFDKMFL